MKLYYLSVIQIIVSFVLAFFLLDRKELKIINKVPFSKEEVILYSISLITVIASIFIKTNILLILGIFSFYTLLIVDSNDDLIRFKTCTIFFASILLLTSLLIVSNNHVIKFIIILAITFQSSSYLKFGNFRQHFLKNLIALSVILSLGESNIVILIYGVIYISFELFLSYYTKRMILLKNQNLITISTRITQLSLILISIDKVIL